MSMPRRSCWFIGLCALTSCAVHDRILSPDPEDGGTAGTAGSGASGSGGSQGGASTGTGGAGGATATGGSAGSTAAGGSGGATTSGSGGSGGASTGGSGGSGAGTAGSSVGGGGPTDAAADGQGGSTTGGSDGGTGDVVDEPRPPTAQDPDCDLNGIWIAQQVSVATALSAPQYANVWSYIEFEQKGVDVVVANHFECGGEVKGTLHVTLRDVTTRSLITHNRQKGRRGTMQKSASGTCDAVFERYWGVRGAVEADFIPSGGRNSSAALMQVQMERPLPKPATPTGAEDWDMDTFKGIGWDVAGAATGRRHSVQRDWSRWFTDSSYTITPAKNWQTDIMARTEVEIEDSVFDTEPAGNFLLAAATTPDARNVNNRFILRFLGRDASDPRVAAIPITATDPDNNAAGVLATCLAIQAALPAKQAR